MDSSKDDPITKARTEVAHLQERKRRVYLAVLAFTIAITITLLSWWTGPAEDPFIASVYPVFATVLAVLFLLKFLERAVAQAARHERPLAVISADIDRFKRINDTRGHAIGDAIIAETAERLSACVRDTDLVVRWGGEEFLIVAPDSDVDGARDLAERCRRAVEDTPIAGVWVTSTFGVTAHQPGDTVDRVLARVDALLYSGKHCGRNVVIAEAGDTPVSG